MKRKELSRDYNALFDLITSGGEALASVVYTGGERDAKLLRSPVEETSMSLRKMINYGGIYSYPEDDQRESFVKSCTRLELEWISILE